jgi:CRP-like cAMP-binding protein
MRDAVIREYEPNEVICRQGGRAERVVLLKKGAVRSVVIPEKDAEGADDARLRRGRDVNLHLEKGIFLGVDGALLGKYTESLITVEPATVVEVPVDARAVISMIAEDPEFGLSLARSLARKLVGANRGLGGVQREAARFSRELQGLTTDFYNLVHRIQEDAEGEDDVLRALSVAKRSWSHHMGESGGAEVTKQTTSLIARVVDDNALAGSQQRLKKGDLLCRRGDPGKSVYILISGRLSVRIGNELYGIVRPGETVGEISVLLGDEEPRRIADIQAEEPSVVGVVPGEAFPQLCKAQPKLLINICKLLAMRSSSTQQLAAESEGALKAVLAKFGSEKCSFVPDCEALKSALDLLMEEFDFPLQIEHEVLTRMAERWQRKMEELQRRVTPALAASAS